MSGRRPRSAVGRAGGALTATAVALAVSALFPSAALAVDLFPVDDWLGSGIKGLGEVALGPLKVGAESIARLLVTIVGALADLLVPKSLIRAGLDGIRWLVALPPVGTAVDESGAAAGVRMPHLHELREVLTWIGVTLLPLGLIVSAARAYLAPGVDGESPSDLLARVLAAAVGLLIYDWAWGVLVRLVKLITDGLLGLPWVADGIERMLETLLIGGASGAAVAAEFVVPLMVLFAGGTLLGLVLVHVGLMVATSLVYVLGGLILGLSVTSFGRRLLAAWLLAVTAVVVLPVLWSVVFVTGAALMLDAQPAAGQGFAGFIAQLFNVVAAGGTFFVAIKLSLAVFRNATGAITGVTAASPATSGVRATGAAGAGRSSALAANATPAGLARFSAQMRGRATALVGTGAHAAISPVAHPVRTLGTAARAAVHPIQTTQAAAGNLRAALGRGPAVASASGAGGSARAAPAEAKGTSRPAATAPSSDTDGAPQGQPARGDAAAARAARDGSAARLGESSPVSATRSAASRVAPTARSIAANPAGTPPAPPPRGSADAVPQRSKALPTADGLGAAAGVGRARWWPLARIKPRQDGKQTGDRR